MSAAEDLIRRVLDDIACACGGRGVITEMTEMEPGQVAVAWLCVHRPGCMVKADEDEPAWLMDADALDRGDFRLPGHTRPGRPEPKETNR